MNEPSEEQQLIIDSVKNGNNVIVDACAGSGKSTTILSAALQMPHKKFLQITYNSSLRKEIKEKVKELGLKNIIVHTYHSLAVAKYSDLAYTDTGIRNLLYENKVPNAPIIPQDVIVLDESQDMTLLYFTLIVKFLRDMNSPCQMMILGDYKQGLYEFKGADIRFLTHAKDLWKGLSGLKQTEFHHFTLKTSYRITKPMAQFVNQCMLSEERLIAVKEGDPVVYLRNSNHVLQNSVVYYIKNLINSGVQPNEIFVLGASVKGSNSQIRRIENALVSANIPCYVPMFETDRTDEKVMEGKVVFTTFHCVKGRQRGYVFVIGFDDSYLTFFDNGLTVQGECPNTLYVGCTRATKKMYLLERDQFEYDRPLKFLKMSHHKMIEVPYVEFKGHPRTVFYEESAQKDKENNAKYHYTTPTDLLRFIPEIVLENIHPILSKIFVYENEEKEVLDIPVMIHTKKGFYEDVSDLNGIALPCVYYDYIKCMWNVGNQDESVLYEIIKAEMENVNRNTHFYLYQLYQELPRDCETMEDYLYMANLYQAIKEKLYFKLHQIQREEYTWLLESVLCQCKTRLMKVLEKECTSCSFPEFEKTIIHTKDEETHSAIDECLMPYFTDEKFRFTARADLITENVFWEIKCTNSISSEHQLQLVIYAWIMLTIYPRYKKQFKIFNIKTGEIMVLNASKDVLDEIVVEIIKGKYRKQNPLHTETFLEEGQKIISKYFPEKIDE